jgi:hypothetical protein
MRGKLLATAILALLAVSAILTVIPSTIAATITFGNTSAGTITSSISMHRGTPYTCTASGPANSITAYLSYSAESRTFGDQPLIGSLAGESIEGTMRGQAFTTEADLPVKAISIGANIYCSSSSKSMQAAIYDSAGILLAKSNTVLVSADVWSSHDQTFTLQSPVILNPGVTYVLVVESASGSGSAELNYSIMTGSGRQASATYGNWPSVTFSSNNKDFFIWCNYQTTATKATCAIYSSNGLTRISKTEETTVPVTTGSWITFNFNSKPMLTSGTQYILTAWSRDSASILYSTTNTQSFAGTGLESYPNWGIVTSVANPKRDYSIYCTIQYPTITAVPGEGGTISPSGVTNVAYGSSQSFSITPNTGFHITNVFIDGSPIGAVTSYNFPSVTSDHVIGANFYINSYTITVTQTVHGTISPGTTNVNYNTNQVFSITPETGYRIADVLVDGSSVGAVASYRFTNVNAPHTITANYAINQVATSLTVACTPETVDKSGSMITTVSGTLTTSLGAPIAGKPVVLTYNDGTEQSITTACTQADGSYSYTWTAPSSLPNGFYRITATYTGDNNPYQSSTAVTTVGGGGLFVVPEYALGALGAVFALFAAFGIVKIRQKNN